MALLGRGVALANVYGGVSAVPLALTMPHLTGAQRAVTAVIGTLVAIAGAHGAWRPSAWSSRARRARSWAAPTALGVVLACSAALGTAHSPLFNEMCVIVGMGAAGVGVGFWAVYGGLAALLALVAGTLAGQNGDLVGQRYLGWVLCGASASVIVAAYFGAHAGAMSLRIRRLQVVMRRDGERIVRVNRLVDELRALHARCHTLLAQFEQFTGSLEPGARRTAAEGVAASRRALLNAGDMAVDDPRSDGLAALLGGALAAFSSQLTVVRGVRLGLDLQPAAYDVPVRVVEAVKEFVWRSLDNVERWAPATTEVLVSARRNGDWLEVCVEDDGGGHAPRTAGEGSGHTMRQLSALGGDFALTEGNRGVRAVARVPLIGAGKPRRHGGVRPVDRLVPVVAQTASRLFRATRWALAVSMLAMTALDVPGGSLPARLAAAVAAVVLVEVAFWRAGLRGERRDALPWVLTAVAVAIVASGVVSQADRFQTNGWAGVVMLELAWRYGWRWWVLAELVRIPIVVAGFGSLAEADPAGAVAAQVLFPLTIGLTALAAHRLVASASHLELQLGSTSERWRRVSEAVRSAVVRHDVVAPLSRVMAGRANHPLAEQLRDLNEQLRDRVDNLAAVCTLDGELRSTVHETLEAIVAPATVRIVREELLLLERPGFPGDAIDRYGRRSSLLDLLAKLGEVCVHRCPPDLLGRPRLRALDVALIQTYPGEPVTLTIVPITRGALRGSEDEELSHYASTVGATITEGLSDGTVSLRLPVAAFA